MAVMGASGIMRRLTYPRYRMLTRMVGLCLSIVFPLVGLVRSRFRKRGREMRGYHRGLPPKKGDTRRLWLHAVSVGEVEVVTNLAHAFLSRPESKGWELWVSTTTSTGQARLRNRLGNVAAGMVYFPIDTPGATSRALDAIEPDAVGLLETELWPNFVHSCRALGIPVCLLNGRISKRSVGRYAKLSSLMPEVLGCFEVFSMIHEDDASRIRGLGAPADRVVVAGNAKHDTLTQRRKNADLEGVRAVYGLQPGCGPVFVAGSTRRGEESFVIDAYLGIRKAVPDLVFVWAPRHPQYTAKVEAMLKLRGVGYRLRSGLSDARPRQSDERLIVVDGIGELFALYGIADAAFSGGSLVPKGGHNILEIAVWEKPPIYGPSYEDFQDAHDILELHHACRIVKDVDAWIQEAVRQLTDGGYADKGRECAKAAMEAVHAATDRHVDVLLRHRFLSGGNPRV
ncbi:MAG: glycosyltransferase N-terminal domain-containing protein [Opitutales bacterium]|nr:glycosyltransferase N-terminal domain-containing protein [Opitutales bacterium]